MNNQAILNLTLQLQKSLDSNYDVVDMQTVLYVIQQLENTTITKEQLETTRLGRYINELRRRTSSESLARRAKNLLKKWRDIFMPALQQQQQQQQQPSQSAPPAATAAAAATASTTANTTTASTTNRINPNDGTIGGGQQIVRPPQTAIAVASTASSTTASTLSHLQQTSIVTNNLNNLSTNNNISTGSANNNNNNNNNNTNSKNNSNLSNGGVQPLIRTPPLHRTPPPASSSGNSLSVRTTSPMYGSWGEPRQHLPPPTSFANVLNAAHALQSSCNRPSFLSSTGATSSHVRSESPLSHITQQRHRQSPAPLFDYAFNNSRPQPAVTTPNSSRQRNLLSVNGENNMMTTGGGSVSSNVADGDLLDSNSVTLDIAGDGALMPHNHDDHSTNQQQSSTDLLMVVNKQPFNTLPMSSSVVSDVCSSSSSHRKSKKHKKDKKRNKQSPDEAIHNSSPLVPAPNTPIKTPTRSSIMANLGPASFLSQYASEPQIVDDDLQHITTAIVDGVGGGGGGMIGSVFPPHDSLSSSSMSRFPSNISTNTMSMQNCSRLLAEGGGGGGSDKLTTSIRGESDLTFAGKFKSTNNTTTTVCDLGIIGENVTMMMPKKSYSDSKDSSDVVVVESRSCSPFTVAQMGPDDSCSSSSRATMSAETLHINAESNQEIMTQASSIETTKIDLLQLPPILMQGQPPPSDHSASGGCNNSLPAAGAVLTDRPENTTITTATIIPTSFASNTTIADQSATTTAVAVENAPPAAPAPKKRGRKKGSRGYDAVIAQTHAFLHASMFERPRMFLGGPKKVKTTKELLADIQNRRLGSSATSSPTLATSRQSVSPSTCSEASFQSDLTNTRASLPNMRSSPDLGTLANCRQSDIDDINSATDSNEAITTNNVKPSSSATEQLSATKADAQSKVAGHKKGLSSLDEYLTDLKDQLPPVDLTALHHHVEHHHDDGPPCTCVIRTFDPNNTQEQVIIKSEDDDESSRQAKWPSSNGSESISQPPQCLASVPMITTTTSQLQSPQSLLSVKKLSPSTTKKPVKSIFDLDYDEDNDPLHSFVEAVKLRLLVQQKEQEKLEQQQKEQEEREQQQKIKDETTMPMDDGAGNLETFKTTPSTPTHDHLQSFQKSSTSAIASTSETTAFSNGTGGVDEITVATAATEVLPATAVTEVVPPAVAAFPLYEAVEDANCAAKYRYEIQTNNITQYHLNVLHNCFVPNVNGCWSAPSPITSDHIQRLNSYVALQQSNQTIEASSNGDGDCGIDNLPKPKPSPPPPLPPLIPLWQLPPIRSWWVDDPDFRKNLITQPETKMDDKLYERVVPKYDHINQDRIIKDLSRVQFSKDYVKKKTISYAAVDGNSTLAGNQTESRKAKKRKRSRTSKERLAEDANNENDGGGGYEKKHKHRRKKQKKLRHVDHNNSNNNLEDTASCNHPVDTNLSSTSDIKDVVPAIVAQAQQPDIINMSTDDGVVDCGNSDQKGTITSPVCKMYSIAISNIITRTTTPNDAHDTDNACDIASGLPVTKDISDIRVVADEIMDFSGLDVNHHPIAANDPVNKTDHDHDDVHHHHDQHQHRCAPNVVDVTLIESSFSNSSNSCTNNIGSSSIKEGSKSTTTTASSSSLQHDAATNNITMAAAVVVPSIDQDDYEQIEMEICSNSGDYSYCSGGDPERSVDNVDYNEYYDDEDDYHHNDGEEHEVVTHDMTSSTSTTSQQHIVLTIKKKKSTATVSQPPTSQTLSATSHVKLMDNNGQLSSPSPPPPFLLDDDDNAAAVAAIQEEEPHHFQHDQGLSIITSASTPTTIKIRRTTNKQQQQQENVQNFVNMDLDNIHQHEHDNNNIKNGLDSPARASLDHHHNVIDAEHQPVKIEVVEDPPARASLDHQHSVIEAEHQPVKMEVVDLQPFHDYNENVQDINILPSVDFRFAVNVNDYYDDDTTNSSYGLPPPRPDDDTRQSFSGEDAGGEIDVQYEDSNSNSAPMFRECNNSNENVAAAPASPPPQPEAEDQDDNPIVYQYEGELPSSPPPAPPPQLPIDNNGLLVSFNQLTDDNRSGLRLIQSSEVSSTTPSTSSDMAYEVQQFREWYESVQAPSYNDELLEILPYVVID